MWLRLHLICIALLAAAFTGQTGFAPIHQLEHATDEAAFVAFDILRTDGTAPSQKTKHPLPAHPEDNCPLCRLASQGLPPLAAPPVLIPPLPHVQPWRIAEPRIAHLRPVTPHHWHSRAPPAGTLAA